MYRRRTNSFSPLAAEILLSYRLAIKNSPAQSDFVGCISLIVLFTSLSLSLSLSLCEQARLD